MRRRVLGAITLVAAGGAAADGAAVPATAEPAPNWAATVGFVANVGPEYPGASRIGVRLQPGFALRWGRIGIASRSAFSVRGGDPGTGGGLRVDLGGGERWRAGLGLRWDNGRKESSSPDLQGLGDVGGTLRARLALSWRFDDGWRVSGSATVDALGRAGGWQGELSVGRDYRWSERTELGTALTLGFAGASYMQSRFGITPEQSLASGYAPYAPGTGLRDLVLSGGGRTELGGRWALFYGASVSLLLRPAAASPLVREPQGWGLSAGLVRRL